jgi:hypothetical protein
VVKFVDAKAAAVASETEVTAVAAASAVEVVAEVAELERAPAGNPFARFKNLFAKKAGEQAKENNDPIPWGELAQSTPLRALCVVGSDR